MNKKRYVEEIVQRSCLPKQECKRLKKDLHAEINTAMERGESIEEIIERMGDPDTVAAGIYENFAEMTVRPFSEYKSKRTLFGLPLVHVIRMNYHSLPYARTANAIRINPGRTFSRYGLPTARGFFAFGPKAKGVVAVGNRSTGVISIGILSAGIVSIGNISAGLFSLGNLAIGFLVGFGNAVAGLLSTGNIAIGHATLGNIAIGEYAIGNEAAGAFTYTISNLATQFDEVKQFLSELGPPFPIKTFYNSFEKISELVLDPQTAAPVLVALSAALIGLILLLCLVPRRLLMRSSESERLGDR